MWRRTEVPRVAIFLIILLGVGYSWVHRFKPLPFGETSSDVPVWNRWVHRVRALTDNGEVIGWRYDNVMETNGPSSNTNSDTSTRKCTRDAVQRINL